MIYKMNFDVIERRYPLGVWRSGRTRESSKPAPRGKTNWKITITSREKEESLLFIFLNQPRSRGVRTSVQLFGLIRNLPGVTARPSALLMKCKCVPLHCCCCCRLRHWIDRLVVGRDTSVFIIYWTLFYLDWGFVGRNSPRESSPKIVWWLFNEFDVLFWAFSGNSHRKLILSSENSSGLNNRDSGNQRISHKMWKYDFTSNNCYIIYSK